MGCGMVARLTLIFVFSLAGIKAYASDINETSSRHLRSAIMCDVATKPGHKPRFSGRDNIIVSEVNYTYADLDGDTVPEFITGAWDEPLGDYPLPHHPDHSARNRSAFPYHFYSRNADFAVPANTSFQMARKIITNDFNNDGRHDVAFIQHGPDFAPYEPRHNDIMLSQPDGSYEVTRLPGPKSLFHGGSSGDIDNDGDVDILVTPGPDNEVLLYLNNGDGTFSHSTLFSDIGRNYNMVLWDVDDDGNLDVLLDGHEEPLAIFWGDGAGDFSDRQVISGFDDQVMHDIDFADFDGDGKMELAVLSSLKGMKKRKGWYVGFKIQTVRHTDRTFSEPVLIHHSPIFWLAWITACDLKDDGRVDLVYEQHGERWHGEMMAYTGLLDFTKIDKLVWRNDGNGVFSLYRIEDPQYFNFDETSAADRLAWTRLIEKAQGLGLSLTHYDAPQTYYPTGNGKTYRGSDSFHPANIRNEPLDPNGPTSTDYSGIEHDFF